MKQFCLLSLLIGFNYWCTGQTNGSQFALPTIIPNAPQSAALGRYGEVPVSINTGVPNISVPLYEIKTGTISVPISISYHGSGVKVMDHPSTIGLGWALSAGGDISRVVQGLNDETNNTGYTNPGTGFSLMSFPSANDPALPAKEKCIAANICNTYETCNPWDGQPDLYFYNFGNKSGQFIPKNMVSTLKDPGFMTIPYSPIIITKVPSPGWIYGFNITDIDGITYTFMPYDSSTVISNTSNLISKVTTAWHLTKILSADRSDSVVFKYSSWGYYYSTNLPPVLKRNYDVYGVQTGYTNGAVSTSTTTIIEYALSEIDFPNGKITLDINKGYDATSNTKLDALHIYNFTNNAYQEIKRFTLYHSDFKTNQDQSVGGYYYALRLDSLVETGISPTGNITNPPYVFNYYSYNGFQCPPFGSNAQDFFGYFNGLTTNTDLTFVTAPAITSTLAPYSAAYKRMPDSNYMRVGTLQTMQYPTGGTTTFDFEPNQTIWNHIVNDTVYVPFGQYISASIVQMTPSVSFTLTQNLMTQFQSSGATYTVKLDFTGSQQCTLSSTCVANTPRVILKDLTSGTTISDITLENIVNGSQTSQESIVYLTLTTGHNYQLYFPTPGAPGSGQSVQTRLDCTLSGESVGSVTPVNTATTVLTGGLRIRGVTSNDMNGKTLMRQYKYTQSYFNSSLFNGDFNGLALNSYQFDSWTLGNNPGGCSLWVRTTTNYSTNFTLPLGSGTNNSASYNEVEEYESDGNNNYLGKTVYDYNQALDLVMSGMPFYKISKEYNRSLLKEKRLFKYAAGTYSLLEDDLTNYTDLDSAMTAADTVIFYTAHGLVDNWTTSKGSPNSQPIGGFAFGCLGCEYFDMQTKFLVDRSYYTTSRIVPKTTISTFYGDNGNSIVKQMTYDYQNTTDILPTHTNTLNSDGIVVDKYINYVLDYPAATSCTNNCINNFNQGLNTIKTSYYNNIGVYYQRNLNNQVQAPYPNCGPIHQDSVLDYQSLYDAANISYQHSIDSLMTIYNSCLTTYNGCVTSYYNTASANQKGIIDLQSQNNILPQLQNTDYRSGTLASTLQTNYNTIRPFVTQPSTVLYSAWSNPVETRLQFLNYDIKSHVLEVAKPADAKNDYIYDYNGEYAIAKVVNADSNSIAFTSFEADGSGKWTIPSSIRDTVNFLTGTRSYNLTNGAITKTNIVSGVVYIISYWSKSGSYSISGGTSSVRTGRSYSPWTYYEHTVTATSTTITISGSGNIDELRCYPQGSQMTSYTYTPLIGVTTMNDVNSEITFYNYDALQRLKTVSDYQGNMIKDYQYNYSNINSCGSNCEVLNMQTLTGSQTLSYPVGVLNVNGKRLGNATNQAGYITLWMSDTADAHTGTIVAGPDSMHFKFTVNSGRTIPNSLTGLRYFQIDLPYTMIDAFHANSAAYIDFGDGTGMYMPATVFDSNTVRAPNTNIVYEYNWESPTGNGLPYYIYWVHTYPDTSLKTLTFYHNDGNVGINLDNAYAPATSLTKLRNLRGNLQQYTTSAGMENTQQASMSTFANVANWNTINSVTSFYLSMGDQGASPNLHVGFTQDFMANNKNLSSIQTQAYGLWNEANGDSTFKISKLKTNWNTYFTKLSALAICDRDWNHEDLTALTSLYYVAIYAGSQNYTNNQSGNSLIPMTVTVIDNIINQVSAGAGQHVTGGTINLFTAGTARSSASNTAVTSLKANGWTIIVNGVNQ